MTIYYAAINRYATSTSMGFANSWGVIGFSSKSARDAFVESRDDLATRAIPQRDVTKYASNWHMTKNQYIKPAPFSGEYWGLVEHWAEEDAPKGYVGHVEVCDPYGYPYERVFG